MAQPSSVPGAETIDIVPPSQDPLARWSPVAGEETLSLLDHLRLSPESQGRLLREAVSTLARCTPPAGPQGQETGLIIGYVQSGKTMSFTTVSALARDNGYRLVIVATGLTVNLYQQSRDRLERDLRINERSDRKWLFLANPRDTQHVRHSIAMALEGDDDDIPGLGQQTVLIAVMKNGTHLDHLNRLLERLNLASEPALVIDDEADQATLNNNVRQGTESATYRRMARLRSLLPHHTFLQYTATPQALLLINLIDILSPNFAEVLTPGATYTGGRAFFENGGALVRRIPDNEIPAAAQPLTEPPDSLLEAMRVFLLGVTAGMMEGEPDNRSMMVHPASRTMRHADYAQWVIHTKDAWGGILGAGDSDPDYADLIRDFRGAYEDLSGTVAGITPFEELVPHLRRAVRRTVVTVVNAAGGRTPRPDWPQVYSHIVVGGEVLNRGYTIEGLTVTYMPRGPGMNQADTIQQRARWFGYKADYLGYCRVYLSQQMQQAYAGYVEHETRLRDQLYGHRETGASLRQWRRAFFLDPSLRPTRNSVIDLEPIRGSYSDSWCDPKAPHDSAEATLVNRDLVARLLERLGEGLQPDEGDPRRKQPFQTHRVAHGVSLRSIYEELLTRLRVTRPVDSTRFTGLLLQVGRYLEDHPEATCTVYQMSAGVRRDRGVDDEGEILNLFQGADFDRAGGEMVYPGDREIHAPNELTIQIHTLRVTHAGAEVEVDVPAVAVWVPRAMGASWISQAQGQG